MVDAIELREGWQYKWGESPRGVGKRFLWLGEPWQDPSWISSSLPESSLEGSEPTKAWYRVKLPQKPSANGLFIRDLHQVFEVYQNQQLIYAAGDLRNDDNIEYLGFNWHLISLIPGDGEQILTFRVHSNVHGIGFRREAPRLVDAFSFLQSQAVNDAESLILGIALTFMSICALTLFAFNRADRLFLAYGVLTLGLGSWFLVTNMTLTLMTSAHQILYIANKVAIHLSAIGFCLFVQEVVSPIYKRYATGLWISHVLCLGVGIYTHYLPGYVWSDIGFWYRPFLVFTAVSSFVLILINERSGTEESKQFLYSFLILAVTLVLELIHWITVEDRHFVLFMPWGVFAMVLFQGRILLDRYQKVHQDLKLYSNQLEQRSDQLERSNQKLLEMDLVKNEFLANTSHEIRTPLHGMIGLAEGLLSEAKADVKTNLSLIISSGERLSRLIDDILDYSKIAHNDLKLVRTPVSIRPFVDAILQITKPLAQGRDITFAVVAPDDCPLVLADENRVQ